MGLLLRWTVAAIAGFWIWGQLSATGRMLEEFARTMEALAP